jgi:hypothetical protein
MREGPSLTMTGGRRSPPSARGQGTKYADVLTVFWWADERDQNYGFKFGVLNYTSGPKS